MKNKKITSVKIDSTFETEVQNYTSYGVCNTSIFIVQETISGDGKDIIALDRDKIDALIRALRAVK